MKFLLTLAFLGYLIAVAAVGFLVARRVGWLAIAVPLVVAGGIAILNTSAPALFASVGAIIAGVFGATLGVEARKAGS